METYSIGTNPDVAVLYVMCVCVFFSHPEGVRGLLCVQEWNLPTHRHKRGVAGPQARHTLREDHRVRVAPSHSTREQSDLYLHVVEEGRKKGSK